MGHFSVPSLLTYIELGSQLLPNQIINHRTKRPTAIMAMAINITSMGVPKIINSDMVYPLLCFGFEEMEVSWASEV
jgi:hypothetical protein